MSRAAALLSVTALTKMGAAQTTPFRPQSVLVQQAARLGSAGAEQLEMAAAVRGEHLSGLPAAEGRQAGPQR